MEEEEEPLLLPEASMIARIITYPVERIDLTIEVVGNAAVTPTREQDLYFRDGGRVTELSASPQQEIRTGEVLAALETSELEHSLRMAEIDLEIARLRYEAYRLSDLSPMDLRIRGLELEKEKLTAEFLRQRLEASIIRSPYDGLIKSVRAKVGELVGDYETVVQVFDPEDLELQMTVTRDDFDEILPGMDAVVEIRRDVWVPARVERVSSKNPSLDPTIRREEFIAHLALDEEPPLRIGARFAARIIIATRPDTLVIPTGGLREFRGQRYVRVLDGDLRREAYVKVGVRTETQVEILDGLAAGDLVIGK